MTRVDEDDLIERLQDGIAERQSDIEVPAGIGDRARRAARRRSATRTLTAGVPVLATAAAAAVVLATGSVPGLTAATGPPTRVAGGLVHPVPVVAGGSVRPEDTAYIVRRVRANVAKAGRDGTVIDAVGYASGAVSSDGALVDLGWKLGDVYDYTAPNGIEYQRELMYEEDGRLDLIMTDRYSPNGGGSASDLQTIVNLRNHTYSKTRYRRVSPPRAGAGTPNLYSSPSEVRRALRTGRVARTGTATVDGAPAISLSIALPRVSDAPTVHLTLYVDARTYRPLRTVTVYDGTPSLEVADWVPATRASIARATDDSIPTGYTKVDKPSSR